VPERRRGLTMGEAVRRLHCIEIVRQGPAEQV
jgi:hypothetical protein